MRSIIERYRTVAADLDLDQSELMTEELIRHGEHTAIAPDRLVEAAQRYARAARSPNTQRAYDGDWRRFCAWCVDHDQAALPAAPATIALYITHLAESGRKPATIRRARAAIGQAHRLAGFGSPAHDDRVREVERGIRRELGTAQRQAKALLPDDLHAGILRMRLLPPGPRTARDRAMLCLGLAGGLRRSELVAVDMEDLTFEPKGLVLAIHRSKTDQEGHGALIAIPPGQREATCPVRAVQAWLQLLGEATTGPVFREIVGNKIHDARASTRAVTRAVKRAARYAGLDPSDYSGHSLRAGLATAAATADKSDRAIMRQGRWASRATVDRYVRDGRRWADDNAADGIGL